MQLPTPLLRKNKKAHKNAFGHVLVIAGSPPMLGAGALTSLAAMRSGAGLVTWAVPKSLNLTAQKKAANVVMTLPLPAKAADIIIKNYSKFNAIAIGPGLSTESQVKKFVAKIICTSPVPLVIDADALNCIAGKAGLLLKTQTVKILTPHLGEMGRLIGKKISDNEKTKISVAKQFAKKYKCVVLLKGNRTIVAGINGKIYINCTGNVGMATAGSGDVLTGMIAAFLAQGLEPFEAAKLGAYFHGKAGDAAAKKRGKVSMIASDIINEIRIS
ncbi:MAG: NAD(P)H-hydrate dehydratase [Candidatus Omnitrophica bacterium]|nr:NAD(P)H-hydrate dehydratase [Candidatus Omnitrophota bacterium]